MKKLIEEEIKKFLNENYENNNKFSFVHTLTDITQISFFNYNLFTNEYDTDITNANIIVNWNLFVNTKEWGIKSFDVEVSNVSGGFILDLLDKQTDEVVQELEKNIEEFDWKFICETSTLSFDDSIYIKELEFDFKSQICRVKF
jgi:hypothetical protein